MTQSKMLCLYDEYCHASLMRHTSHARVVRMMMADFILSCVLQCPSQYYDADESPSNMTCLLCASGCASRLQQYDKTCQVRKE
jgi:hypothetical protein